MAKHESFSAFAAEVAHRNGLEAMLPVVEKELLHYDIMHALDASGWLERLVFQGGTCLRLCYGNVRYSEDLDFTSPEPLDGIDLAGFAKTLSRALDTKYHVGLRVHDPKRIKAFEGGGTLKRWQVVVDTAPERPDLPSQRIKIEVAHIPSYTPTPTILSAVYPQVGPLGGDVLLVCQTTDEILADKIVSFANSPAQPRYRDLWDIPWIILNKSWDQELVSDLVKRKHGDYGCPVELHDLLERGARRAEELGRSSAFLEQMRRFIPTATYERTLGRPSYTQALANRTVEAYTTIDRILHDRA